MPHDNRVLQGALFEVALLVCLLACAEPAVVNDEPAGAVLGMGAVGGFAGAANAGAGGLSGASGAVGGGGGASGGVGGASGGAGGVGGESGTATGGIGGFSGAGGAASGGVGGASGGVGGASGGVGGMGGEGDPSGGVGGMAGDEALGPCPAGWTCEDTSALGATDKDGNLITGLSCGKGGLVECDDANPAASCPELTKPLCAHVFGIASCTQLCTP